MIKRILMIACMAMPAHADGLFVYGSAMRNLDHNTDYWQTDSRGTKHMTGIAEVKIGYAWMFDHARIEAGLQHTSNPYTGEDYGLNGVFVGGCWGAC